MREREYGADVIRIVATFFIIAVHFYLHNGFYYESQTGISMALADCARWLFFSCVPLFAMLTGYLKCKAVPDKKYYKGIVPILLTWLLVSAICIAFKILYLHTQMTAIEWLAELLNYKAANYSWYIEMYFSLFLLCPLLNTMFHKEKRFLIAALITFPALAFLPSVGNGYMVGEIQLDFIPNYIGSLWPIAYYVMGAGICLLRPKLPRSFLFFFLIALCAIAGLWTFFTAGGGKFGDGHGGGYNSWLVALITSVIFLILYPCQTHRKILRKLAAHISKRCLIIYLISWIFDTLIQPLLQPFTTPDTYWWVFILHTGSVFLLSLLVSEIIYPVVHLLLSCRRSEIDSLD